MLTGLVTGFALILLAFIVITAGLRSSAATSTLVRHTYEVKDSIADLTVALERSEASRRGYLLEPSAYRRSTFEEWSSQILPALQRLTELTSDNDAQRQRLASLKPVILNEIAELDRSMSLATEGRIAEARTTFGLVSGLDTLQQIRTQTIAIAANEEQLLDARAADSDRQLSLLRWMLLFTGAMLAAVAVVTFWLVRRYTRDLLLTHGRLNQLNAGLETRVAERTSDLKRANEEIQRFAYIVSHDLRSPLVNVMGFTAELDGADKLLAKFVDEVEAKQPTLVDDKVRLAVREDLPEAIGFIRASTQKMDRLINAILALSRQGRRVLAPERLDMEELIEGIRASLATVAAQQSATILVEKPLPELVHDRLAIEQIFQNLIENATKYLQPGRPGEIVVRGKRTGQRAQFEVTDNGRGIAPGDQERVFELFRRAGAQDQTGEGIGLANVRALAYRLGGNVTVESEPGRGSTFIVELPVALSSEGDE